MVMPEARVAHERGPVREYATGRCVVFPAEQTRTPMPRIASGDAWGMHGKASRQRCTECRGWYRPHESAVGHQKTCSAECRRARRNRLACRRRASQLEEYREQERRRQRRHRAHRGRAGRGEGTCVDDRELVALYECTEVGEVTCTGDKPVSRAGLGAKPHEITEAILNIWDENHAASRARVRRQVGKMIQEIAPLVGHPGP